MQNHHQYQHIAPTNNASVTITPDYDQDWLVMTYSTIAPSSTDQFESRLETTGGISSTIPLESIEGEDPTNDLMNFFAQKANIYQVRP